MASADPGSEAETEAADSEVEEETEAAALEEEAEEASEEAEGATDRVYNQKITAGIE